jgi:tyrosyl-tRNA synthetase
MEGAQNDKKVEELLTRGVVETIETKHLRNTLTSGKKLRVKLGIDPTSPDLHLGHTVALRKLRQFQDLGHTAIFLIGDFTARIGDPSGRSDIRKVLSEQEIESNAKHYLDFAAKVIDVKRAEVRRNSEWYGKDGLETLFTVARGVTVQQVMKREDFEKRIAAGSDVSFLESLYPLLQGYDSVALKADVELGGADQKLNLLMGRRIQRFYGIPEQDIVMMPLIEGTDGERKMSKSYGNSIALTDGPFEMFSKTMTIADTLLQKYFETLTDADAPKNVNPREAKLALAHELVRAYHSPAEANAAQERWVKTFSEKSVPEEAPELAVPKHITVLDLVTKAAEVSKTEARRLMKQNAVDLDGVILTNPDASPAIKPGSLLRVGKHRFWKMAVR